MTVQGDVADPNTANLVFKEALDRFGRVDTLVNNAGTFIAKPFISYSNDDYASLHRHQRHRLLSYDPTRDGGNEPGRAWSCRNCLFQPGSTSR